MAGTLVSDAASARGLTLRARPDLIVRPVRYGRRRWWTVKDPLSLRYFQLRDEEYSLLRRLDGRTSVDEIRSHFEREFAPRKLDLNYLQAFLRSLHADGLIVAEASGQGEELLARRRRLRRRKAALAWANLLAIRAGRFDPHRFLGWLHERVGWLFSRSCLTAGLVLVVTALVFAVASAGQFAARAPSVTAFFTPANALWIMAAIATAKILHELAHALACKHFGGECHEMGMLLLVFTPCLYCDVSDIWMLPGKWQRIAVSAAGVVVECELAAACFLLWWFSEPGLFNSLCFNMIVVCSVGTVVFNANPLLRFDGYYILADLVEVPNLRQQSTALVRRALLRWFFDFDPEIDRALPEQHRRWLAAYATASFAYQVFVIVAILWFCRRVLKPHGLDVLAAVVTALVIGGFLIVPVLRLAVFLRNPTWSRNMNWRRFTIRGGVVALLAAVVLWVPLPYAIVAPVALTPADARRVYVSVPGTLRDAVAVGTPVALGTTLAQLENPTVQLDVVRLQADRDRQRLRVAQLERQALDRSAEALIPAAQDALADLEERLRQRRLDQQRLSLVAPAAGTVLPPPSKAESTADDQLPSWSGSPLDEDNRGGYLETGTWLCRIGDPRRHEALLVIDQTDLEFVRRGQTVDLWLDQYPGRRLRGEIYEIAQWDLDIVPRRLVVAGDLPVESRPDGAQQPWSTSYLARVRLDESAAIELIDATGRAKVRVAWQPLARRLIRWLSRTFRLE